MCPDWGLNLKSFVIQNNTLTTDPPGQGTYSVSCLSPSKEENPGFRITLHFYYQLLANKNMFI